MANLSNINGKFVVESTTGYVGVGTTDPNFLIEAAGANSEIALNSTSASIYRLRSTSSDSFIITKNGVGDRLVIAGNGDATFGGNVTTDKLVVDGASNSNISQLALTRTDFSWGIFNETNLRFYVQSGNTTTPNTQVLEIATSGNVTFAGDVGIGISPNQNFHIYKSDATALIQASNTSGIAQLQFFPRDGSNVAHLQSIKGVDSNLTFLTGGNSGNNYVPTERMRIDSSGNVGIGTSDIDFELQVGGTDVSGTANFDAQFAVLSEATTGYPSGFIFKAPRVATSSNRVLLNEDFGTYFSSQVYATSTAGAQSDTPIVFAPLGGNIGIGNTSPSSFNSLGGKQVVIGDGTQTNNLTLFSATTGGGVGYGHIAFADSNASGSTAQYAGLIQYYHGNDSMQFYTNATPRMTILNSGNVGIGTTSNISSPLTIQTNQSANSISIIGRNNGANDEAVISFYEYDGTTRNAYIIKEAGNLGFATGTGGSATERMRIDSNGSIGMGDNVASYRLRVKSEAGTVQNGVYISAGTGNGNHSLYVEDKDGTAEFFAVRGDGEIRLNASSGYTYAAQGIRFGTNASANNLDDYEEGTWTPAVSGSITAGTATYGSQGGSYTKIGNKVTCWFSITNFTQSGAAGDFTITGLPFTCITTSAVRGCFSSNLRFYNMPFPGDVPVISLDNGNNSFIILWSRNNTTWIGQSVANTGNQYIEGYVTYSTA